MHTDSVITKLVKGRNLLRRDASQVGTRVEDLSVFSTMPCTIFFHPIYGVQLEKLFSML